MLEQGSQYDTRLRTGDHGLRSGRQQCCCCSPCFGGSLGDIDDAPRRLLPHRPLSCTAAFRDIVLSARHEQGLRMNNRAENSHLPIRRRERNLQRFKLAGSDRRILAAHAAIDIVFNLQHHIISRRTLRTFGPRPPNNGYMPLPPSRAHPSQTKHANLQIHMTVPAGNMTASCNDQHHPDCPCTKRAVHT